MRHLIFAVLAAACLVPLTSCLKESELETNEQKYKEWKQENELFVQNASLERDENGNPFYTRVVPKWAPQIFALMHWHNDRSLTADSLRPLSNSTVNVIYSGELCDGTEFDNSYKMTVNGDSIFQTTPQSSIPGFWLALENMHVGDSVTAVVPWQAAYGYTGSSTIKPFSTLVFHIKLKSIVHYQTPK